MKKIIKTFLAVLVLLTCSQNYIQAQIHVPFSSDQWQFTNKDYVLEDYLGKPSLLLKNGTAVLTSADFMNGTIEYDMAFPPGRAFIGVLFRIQDDKNLENFYVRPHQSGNPDATQYTPEYNGQAAWQLYHGDGYTAPVTYAFNQWIHVKLVIVNEQMEVFIGDMDTPALFVPQLKRPKQAGLLALNNYMGSSHFANFTYTPLENLKIKSAAKAAVATPEGTIRYWQVSNSFAEKSLATVWQLSTAQKNGLSWQKMPAESTGILNLASGPKFSEERNATFAKVILVSDKAQTKMLQLGFSDRAKVYLNDQIIYSGHDEFMSRDYRFLGTMGYFDEVYLPLKKGRNELWIAVSENFGGWGIQGRIANQSGLTME